MRADHIIVGQGIAGTMLSRELIARGQQVVVIDYPETATASRAASGLMNPVTGQRWTTMPCYEQYLQEALTVYGQLEQQAGSRLLSTYELLHFHKDTGAEQAFEQRAATNEYLHKYDATDGWEKVFSVGHGMGMTAPCRTLDMGGLLDWWRAELKRTDCLREEIFEWQECMVSADGVRYRDINARQVICCDGVQGQRNPFFGALPFTADKGEIIVAHIPGLDREYIYKRELFIVPWRNDLFWIGPSNEWQFDDLAPTPAFRNAVERTLRGWLKLPFTIIDHIVSQRPTTRDHNPFMGMHRQYKAADIFNGFGSKGCLLTPMCARLFADHLLHGASIPNQFNINRFQSK